jgi:DNA-damage-inducible protein D
MSEPTTPFETIRQEDESGNEYWSARDLYQVLGYTNWRNFKTAIDKAKVASANSGQDPNYHFDATIKLIEAGKGATRKVEDYHLSRYACYLVIRAPVKGHFSQWGANPVLCG